MISKKVPIDFDAIYSKWGGGQGGALSYFVSRVLKGNPLDLEHYNSPE